ncbi:MAG: DUF4349 domain-containing protein [Anaerolineae bacterium]|nr:DUF4349 domain-containing protein [Anaerolineae bacterium]
MSHKQRNWLLIGAGIIVGIFVLMVLVFSIPRNLPSSAVAPAPDMAYPGSSAGSVSNSGERFWDHEGYDGQVRDEMSVGKEAPMAPDPDRDPVADQELPQQPIDRMIIRNGSITVAVEDTLAARKTVEDMVAQMAADGAFVVSINEYASGSTSDPYIDLSIRVPATRFDDVMDQIAGLAAKGTIPTQSQSAEDVTNQYVDLDARLETLEAARQRLLEIMAESQNAEDLLNAEQQLTQREAEIASIKGQMQYLSQSAALSAITVSLQPYILSQPVDTTWRPAETVRRSWDALLRSLRNFGDFIIRFSIAVLPWLIVIGLVLFGVVRFVISRARKGQENPSSGVK